MQQLFDISYKLIFFNKNNISGKLIRTHRQKFFMALTASEPVLLKMDTNHFL